MTSEAAIDALIAAFYSAFDNRGGKAPSVDETAALFHEDAVIAKQIPGGGFETSPPRRFAEPRVRLLLGGELVDFHEWETQSRTHVAGDLALRTSRYEKSGTFNGEPYGGCGTKFFQLVRENGEWRILSLAWSDD